MPCSADAIEKMVYEREAVSQGFERIAGVDEAGRGPLAGPIVASAVVLDSPIDGLNDSKQLTAIQRERLFEALRSGPHAIGVEIISAATIDSVGIQSANYAAMLGGVNRLNPSADFLLVDGFSIQGCHLPQNAIIKGDQRSLSIAAASIIAKVTRDRLMVDYDSQYPVYGFARHKGYATRQHLEAIETHGPCPIHRRSFAPIARALETGELFSEGTVP